MGGVGESGCRGLRGLFATMKRKGPAKKQFMVKRPDPTARRDATVTQGEDFEATEEIQTLQKTRQVDEAMKQEQMETYSHHSEPHPVWDGGTRRVAVARPVVEAWQSPDGGTFGEEVKTKVAPQNLVLGHDQGARRKADGSLVAHSILGNPVDFEDRAPTPQQQEEVPHFVP